MMMMMMMMMIIIIIKLLKIIFVYIKEGWLYLDAEST